MTDTTNAAGFIVYQSGCAIFGAGPTPEAAESDAQEWTDGGEIDAEPGGNGEVHGQFYYLPATAALIERVERDGGQIVFDVVGGVADIAR